MRILCRILYVCGLIGMLLSGAYPAAAQSSPPAGNEEGGQGPGSKSQQFQSRVDEAARIVENQPGLKNLSHQQRRDLIEFVVGNMLFTLTHELGHALIGEMDLPVLGREEDAADAFAVVTMLGVGTDVSDRVLAEAARGWFLSDKRNRATGVGLTFYSDHGLDQQRAYQIVCLMVGSDQTRFANLAKKTELPKWRQQSCQRDYSRTARSWARALEPHARTAAQPRQNIEVKYGPGEGPLEPIARAVQAVRLLETVADFAAERYAWPRPIEFEMKTCGYLDARWDADQRNITMCYEVAQYFALLYRDFGLPSPKKPKRKKR